MRAVTLDAGERSSEAKQMIERRAIVVLAMHDAVRGVRHVRHGVRDDDA